MLLSTNVYSLPPKPFHNDASRDLPIIKNLIKKAIKKRSKNSFSNSKKSSPPTNSQLPKVILCTLEEIILSYSKNSKKKSSQEDKIKELIKSIKQNPFRGIGKPEPLKHGLKGYWSRRITGEHRLVYRVSGKKGVDQKCTIIQCRFHYDDK